MMMMMMMVMMMSPSQVQIWAPNPEALNFETIILGCNLYSLDVHPMIGISYCLIFRTMK